MREYKWNWLTAYDRRFYGIWNNMKDRCDNVKSISYKHYWDRWIWYSEERKDFLVFFSDMYEEYTKHCLEFWTKQTTIDRVDSNWNYCKENCKRATREEQWKNRWNYKKYTKSWICISIKNRQ